jgi:phosphomannomutase
MKIGQRSIDVDSGVKFGTSGARGRVLDMTDRVCYAYALASCSICAQPAPAGR